MASAWITNVAKTYQTKLKEEQRQRNLEDLRLRVENGRLERIKADGRSAGQSMWDYLRKQLAYSAREFNEVMGDDLMMTADRASGPFEITLEPYSGVKRVISLQYDAETTTLTGKLFGGGDFPAVRIGIKPSDDIQANVNSFQFTNGGSYYDVEDISRQVINSLVP